MSYKIQEAKTTAEIQACWPVISALRPHVVEKTLVDRIKQQNGEGYRLMFIQEDSIVTSILGYRIQNYLYTGKTLYIDDLCTLPTCKGKGYAGALLDWAIQHAKKESCEAVSLDSGYTRNDAHRLYLNKKFKMTAHHFVVDLKN